MGCKRRKEDDLVVFTVWSLAIGCRGTNNCSQLSFSSCTGDGVLSDSRQTGAYFTPRPYPKSSVSLVNLRVLFLGVDSLVI